MQKCRSDHTEQIQFEQQWLNRMFRCSFHHRLKFQFKSISVSEISIILSIQETKSIFICCLGGGGWVGDQCVRQCEGVGVQADYGWACLLPVTLQRLSYGSCCGRWSATCRIPPSSDQLSAWVCLKKTQWSQDDTAPCKTVRNVRKISLTLLAAS